jgi:hypothetical protein
LAWEESSITESALELVGTLASLEQLHLSAGDIYSWTRTWLINHEHLRTILKPLQRLKRVAFARDTYLSPFPLPISEANNNVTRYYESQLPDLREFDNPQEALTTLFVDGAHMEVFERQHKQRMLHEAAAYVKVFPDLDWIYFGQVFMSIQQTEPKTVLTMLSARWPDEECSAYLDRVFSWVS